MINTFTKIIFYIFAGIIINTFLFVNLEKRIHAFAELGEIIRNYLLPTNVDVQVKEKLITLDTAISNSYIHNKWFTNSNILNALSSIVNTLTKANLEKWLNPYSIYKNKIKNVAVIIAGNIPLVGFHDFLCVLITGNKFVGKLSSRDIFLLPALADILISIESEFLNNIFFTEEKLSDFDAVIATGSNNSSHYFEYYFKKYPHIIRNNRCAVAVLDGTENAEELESLADDIFLYFGLGCRNVSKLYVPAEYNFVPLMNAFEKYKNYNQHTKYFNNYEYNKAISIINKADCKDNGFVILKEDVSLSSPISVVFYEYYQNKNQLQQQLTSLKNQLQCVVSKHIEGLQTIRFGYAQKPQLWDYADDVDTIEFLINLS